MRNQKIGFTLIELLVVIGIILILGGLMFPAFSAAREFARKAKAKTDVKQTEIAFKAILSDYRSWQGAKNATPALPTVTPGGAKQIIDRA